MLERGEGPVRLDDDRLVIGRDTGDDLPPSVARAKALMLEVLPDVEITEVVIAVDRKCGFSEHLFHTAGARSRTPAMLTHLFAAILGQATNLGPTAMARSSGLSYEQIAHATAWYLREETLTPAIDTVVNYHHGLPAAQAWGDGTFSSSDGQRFPVQVKAPNAGALPRYFGFRIDCDNLLAAEAKAQVAGPRRSRELTACLRQQGRGLVLRQQVS